MMNAISKKTIRPAMSPMLVSIFKKVELEKRKSDEIFQTLGWEELPAELKFEVEEDVKGYYDELHGLYSTSCEYVQRRRESVDFWVKSFKDGLCSLQTAIDSLRANKI
jgi:hypothetical protein